MDAAGGEYGTPRTLMQTKRGELFLVGTDGSTDRVYTMPIPDDRDIKTCSEAHAAIAGFDESRVVSQS